VVLILGDRHEALSCALAATSLELPIAHLHGGELSEGSLDDAMRHCITKLAHLHFPATKAYGERIVQLGEDPSRVNVVGAAGLEAIRALNPLSRDELALSLGLELRTPLVAVTFHPASLRAADARAESEELAAALEEVDGSVIVTLPNDDPGGLAVREAMLALEARCSHVRTYAALGQRRYLSLLAHADAVVGNSSSAIIEAPSFKLPVVDVGDRQRGRTRAPNIRNVPPERAAIAAAIAAALDPAFRESLTDMESPYGDGRVSERVLAVLAEAPLGELRAKRFFDLPDGPWRELL
jgi:UDP-hydrolysing UDP-N-acetyl-D-glucosamine 2-epimerase